jgi:hypothetical protein
MNLPSWPPTAAPVGIIDLVFLWWWMPKWQADRLRLRVRDAKASADTEDNFRKSLSQLFGGVAVLLGAAFAHHQTQRTAEQARVAAEQARLIVKPSNDLLISQQISMRFEHFGNEGSVIINLGRIYALEGVMSVSSDYHKSVMKSLSEFVRQKASFRKETDCPNNRITGASS